MHSFKSINLALAKGVQWRLPKAFTMPLVLIYEHLVMSLADGVKDGKMLDVGVGFTNPVENSGILPSNLELIGLDVSESALHINPNLKHAIVADACQPWPLADSSIDFVISHSVIEHLVDTEVFARECYRVLKPGGITLHLLPGRNAPFAVLNRILPKSISRKLLYWAFPEKEEELGFPAYYHSCVFPSICLLFENNGFAVERTHFRYYQSTYFSSFFPIYLLAVFYDLVMWKLDAKRFSSQMLIMANKPVND